LKPSTIAELKEVIHSYACLLPRGGGSKAALSVPPQGVTPLEVGGLSGMLEYQPSEYTFTALAGTPLVEVDHILAENGQFLPFDPPLAERGATLGGTVAAGLSGPARYRYGGVRDFVLGVRFVNAQGELVRSGGKVVKNAAGFDLAKLMVGSLGQYGALVEISFKVFPRPIAYATLRADYSNLPVALDALVRSSGLSLELFGLEVMPASAGGFSLLARLGGLPETFPARLERLQRAIGQQAENFTMLRDEVEAEFWRDYREFGWLPPHYALVKIPLTPARLPPLEAKLAEAGALRRYSTGANLAWVGWRETMESLDRSLQVLNLSGLVVLGANDKVCLGVQRSDSFARRVKQALDPQNKFFEQSLPRTKNSAAGL
jgi:glycolate oxidase FAD binding subunit